MRRVHDSDALEAYRKVLLTLGHVTGYVSWRKLARDWLDQELSGYTTRAITELMIRHVSAGGEIHQVIETRAEFTAWRFHYDLRLPISQRRVYIETAFVHEIDPDDCEIIVVNMHDV